jgi:hypothetical protein
VVTAVNHARTEGASEFRRRPAGKSPRAPAGNGQGSEVVSAGMALAFFLTLPGLVVGLVALSAADRLGWWLHQRCGLPWRRDGARPATAAGLDEIQSVFQPGTRHAIEQRRLEYVLADHDEEGAPPLVRVDLDRQVVIVRAGPSGAARA